MPFNEVFEQRVHEDEFLNGISHITIFSVIVGGIRVSWEGKSFPGQIPVVDRSKILDKRALLINLRTTEDENGQTAWGYLRLERNGNRAEVYRVKNGKLVTEPTVKTAKKERVHQLIFNELLR